MLGIYCRISREKEEGKNVSIPDQKKKGIAMAKELRIDYKIYVDEGISGTLPVSERPSFSKLLEDIAEDKITHLYAVDQSRIERSPETRIVVNTMLKKKGIRMFTDMEGEIDLHDPQQSMVGDIMSAFNKFFVDITTKKVKSALLFRVEEGKAHSSILPYGYTKDEGGYLIIDEEEAEVVKKIYELSLKGKGQRSIAEWLDDHNIPTRYNKIGKGTMTTKNKYTGEKTITNKKDIKWAGKTVQGIIKNPIYKGERLYRGKTYAVSAIVSKAYWQEVNDNLKKNANSKSGNTPKYDYLLKGVLRCGKCGRNYYGRTRANRKDHFYMCSSKRYKGQSCGQRSINIDVIENIIWTEIFLDPDNVEKIHNEVFKNSNTDKSLLFEDKKIYEGKITDLENRKGKAVEYLLDGKIKPEDIQTKIDSLKNEIEKNKKQLLETNKQIENIGIEEKEIKDIGDFMANVSSAQTFQEKKEILNGLLKNIVLHHKEKDDSWVIELEYKTGYTFTILVSKENYKLWLTMKPLQERFKDDRELSEEDWEEIEAFTKKLKDENEGGEGGANSAPKKGSEKSNTSESTSKTELSGWFTNTNVSDVTLADVNQEIKRLFS